MRKSYYINSDFNLSLNESSDITIVYDASLKIHFDLKDGDYNILIFNNANSSVDLFEDGDISNANVNITYLELNDYPFSQNNNLKVHRNSTLNINTIYLGINDKKIKFDTYNLESESLVNINNNVVCLDDADFSLEVVGNIVNGAKACQCHQKSQCLTFGVPKSAKVLPVLNIDENDVEASHSLSSGTIDEDVLFYMNSRGLDKKDALSLLLTSYLMPNEEFYSKFEDGLKLKEIADKKVESIC